MVPLHQHTLCKGSRPPCFPPALWHIRHIGASSSREIELNDREIGRIAGEWESWDIFNKPTRHWVIDVTLELWRQKEHVWFIFTIWNRHSWYLRYSWYRTVLIFYLWSGIFTLFVASQLKLFGFSLHEQSFTFRQRHRHRLERQFIKTFRQNIDFRYTLMSFILYSHFTDFIN